MTAETRDHADLLAALKSDAANVARPEELLARARGVAAGRSLSADEHSRRKTWIAVAASVLMVGVVAVGAARIGTHNRSDPAPATTKSTTVAPVAVTSGVASAIPWTLWAELSPYTGSTIERRPALLGDPSRPVVFGPAGGLQTSLQLFPPSGTGPAGGAGPGGNPTTMRPITLTSSGPGTNYPAKLIIGVTTVPATLISIQHTGSATPLTSDTVTNAKLPGFYFFVVQVPLGHIDSIEALASDGTVLAAAQPDQIPQGP